MTSSTSTADEWSQPANPSAGLAQNANVVVALYLLLCVLSALPFVAIAYPPIVDFANHAARLNLACNQTDPLVAAMYQYRLGIIPDLAIDIANIPACGLVESVTVLKMVTAASLLLIYFSAWLIQRKLFGRPNAFLLLLPAIAFNLVTTTGYINFLAGVAITCLMAALAIGRERDFRALLLLCNVGGLLVFFCHLFALAAVMTFFFGLMLRNAGLSVRGFAIACLRTFALFALPLFFLLLVPRDGHGLILSYHGKFRVLIAPFLAQHVSIGLFGPLLIIPLYLLLKKRIVEFHPLFRFPITALGLYILIIPSEVMTAVDVDSRTIVALAYLALAAFRPVEREREVTLAIGALASAAAAFQLWATLAIWQPFSRQAAELREAVRILPPEAKVLTVGEDTGPELIAFPSAYSHLGSYATIERRIFNPFEFTGVGMQPLSVTAPFAPYDTPAGQPFSPGVANNLATPTPALEGKARKLQADYALRWPQRFDYVVYYHFGRPKNFNPAVLREVRAGSFFSIYKVDRSGGRTH
jgi:hypothetical protein